MRRLAILFSATDSAAWLQLVTFLMAAVHEDQSVSVLFRGQSVYYLKPGQLKSMPLSGHYAEDPAVQERLSELGLNDLTLLLEDIKASGEVKYYACSSSVAIAALDKDQLIASVDAVIGMPAFLSEEMSQADQVLTF